MKPFSIFIFFLINLLHINNCSSQSRGGSGSGSGGGIVPPPTNIKFRHNKGQNFQKLRRCTRQVYCPKCYYRTCDYCWNYCPTNYRNNQVRCPCVTKTTPRPTTWIPYTRPRECNCDPYGSKFNTCNETTGQCICKRNYKGQKCDICEYGFWKPNSTNCVECNCDPAGSINDGCDQTSGFCSCKSGVEGLQCNQCKDKHYGNVKTGCKACDVCDKKGHICDPDNGRCVCPPLTVGGDCGKCAANSWGYEPGIGCKACNCSKSGSTKQQCDYTTGQCICRIGFTGAQCDKCSPGYHGYPKCEQCNCDPSGSLVTDDCENGCICKTNVEGQYCNKCKKGTFGKDPKNPQGCTPCFCSGRSKICTTSTAPWYPIWTDATIKLSLSDCGNRHQCYQLPQKFNTDLVQSYGGFLTIVPAFQYSIYVTGNNITLESRSDSKGETRILEANWKRLLGDTHHLLDDCLDVLSRACLLIVLQNVQKILIYPVKETVRPSEIILDQMQNTVLVEQCSCPKEYTSASCQDPNSGYYRHYPKETDPGSYIDRILGISQPCQCNGRSKICDPQTGYCSNCTNFTTGNHCEQCIEGYYKNPLGNCVPCLCPSEKQNFARNCTVAGKNIVCHCKDGYVGKKCNQCDDNYWGKIEEGGVCERCACHPHGSASLRCDKLSGKCKCKVGFTGKKCNKCSNPRQTIQGGLCMACDECTQILFHTLDDLSNGLNDTLLLLEGGIGPPWGRLNNTSFQYKTLTNEFNKIKDFQTFLEANNITKLENEIDKIKQDLPEKNKILTRQLKTIENLGKASNNVTKSITNLGKQIDKIVKKLNQFNKSKINTTEALLEAKYILKQIAGIAQEVKFLDHYKDVFRKCQTLFDDVNKIYRNNATNPEGIRRKLNDLNRRLDDLSKIADQSDLISKLATVKNQQNAYRISELRDTISQLKEKDLIINSSIGDILDKLSATNAMLEDIDKIGDELFEFDVDDIMKNFDQTVIEENYKQLANVREHVINLQTKIKNLKKLFNFTPDEWKKIDASSSYENLLKGINAARKNANDAQNITKQIYKLIYPEDDDSISVKANLAQAFSDRLEKRVSNLKKLTIDFKKSADELDDLKHGILVNGKNNNELNSVLRNLRQQIAEQWNNTQNLERSKENAKNVSMLIETIGKKVKDTNISMQYDLMKDYHKYLDLASTDEIEKLKNNVSLAKSELEEINIHLSFTKSYDKILNDTRLKERLQQLDALKAKVRQLVNNITYANDRVESISYGVHISKCQRHYKLQNDYFKSLNISFQCTFCTLFKLPNSKNQIIRIDVEDGAIKLKWKDEDRQLEDINTNWVAITRIGSTIKIETQDNTATLKDDEPFQIEEKYPLQIGDLNKQNDEPSCLKKITINNKLLGLWKFSSSEGNCTACYRNSVDENGKDFFGGNGYRNLSSRVVRDISPGGFNFKFTFQTFDENSLIFIAKDTTSACSFIILSLKEGFLELQVKHINDQQITLTSEKKYNTGSEVTAELTMTYNARPEQTQTYKIVFIKDGQSEIKQNVSMLMRENVFKIKKSSLSLGGVSSLFNTECLPTPATSFLGNLKETSYFTDLNTISYNIQKTLRKFEFSKAWFPGQGSALHLEVQISEIPTRISFYVRPVMVNSTFIININNLIDIYIENSNLKVKADDYGEMTFGCLASNVTHFIEINQTNVKINNDNENFTQPFPFAEGLLDFYIGKDRNRKMPDFIGSIGDVFVNNLPIPFNSDNIKSFSRVEIGRDQPESIVFDSKCGKEMQNTERYLKIPPNYKTDPQAFKFGDKPNSYILVKKFFTDKKYVLEFQFRTFYPNGLLFLTTSVPFKNIPSYILLEIKNGDLKLKVQNRKIKSLNGPKKFNDGNWHSIQVEQVPGRKKWRLLVKIDKKYKIKERLSKNNFKGELYVGGIANEVIIHKKLKNEIHPFRGCMRSLKINRNLQVVKNNNNVVHNNVGQCFQNVEEGAYFGGDAYAIYKRDFKVNKFLELSLEFKTVEPNGILLSVSSVGNSPALSVELQNGAVVMTIDMGNGAISKVTNSPRIDSTLGNNVWHNITALYSSSELTVNVDGVRQSWVQSEINSLMDEIIAPLYVGGIPNKAPSGTLKIKENFKGCIRKFKIEDNIKDWTDMTQLNNVQLNSCLA